MGFSSLVGLSAYHAYSLAAAAVKRQVVKETDRIILSVPGRITFETQGVRDASSLVASASKEALDSVRKIAIGQTLVPTHMSRERFGDKSAYAATEAVSPGPQLDLRSPLNAEAAAAGEPLRVLIIHFTVKGLKL